MTASLIRTPGDHALEKRFPEAYAGIPRVRLTRLPTPVERLSVLEREVGIDSLWVKRDDISGDLYGGNKPRKLEFLLGKAVAAGKSTVFTTGGIGTHHGLATAVCARSLGLRTILVLLKQPLTPAVRRSLLLDHAAGADMHYGANVPMVAIAGLRVCAREILRGHGLPYIVPTGGTSPLGVLGYINAAFELADQIAAGQIPEPAWIFVPLGSGGTVAGLVAGARLAGLRSRVAAVMVTDILPPSPAKLARLANRALGLFGTRVPVAGSRVQPEDFSILHGHVGAAYGAPTDEGRRAAELVQRTQGIALETTYTAKCAAALFAEGRERASDGPILFWNTYSSVDPAAHLPPLPDCRELPKTLHQFFQGTVEG